MMTGVSPLEHRILDFVRVNPATGQKEPITSDERQVPAIWNMATAGGKKVGALGFWATYPAEPVNGLMVSDRLFTFLSAESTPPGHRVSSRARKRGRGRPFSAPRQAVTSTSSRQYCRG